MDTVENATPAPNGTICTGCQQAEQDGDLDTSRPCEGCGELLLVEARIDPCGLGDDCTDDFHDYGTDQHVREVYR